ncbi:hypothetical protein [Mesorhizobium sp.]|uniref:hypothetical protein n=1 Tax=Mesorhizobium sp. TaxID=1871066 RepID=UPI0011FFAF9D|nr:hypothetical protein [Mesorhizobium sp.]TIP43661.1 MAG: hypothetical protein E5X62_18135 [Mesorhizobium sp.]
MSFISFNEALARVRARLNLPNSEDVLWEAIRDRRVNAGFPGDHDEEDSAADAWTDYHLNTRAAHMTKADRNAHTKVDLDSLMAWLDSFFAAPTKERRDPHRPKGTGFKDHDAPILAEMAKLYPGECSSATEAAWKVIGRDGKRAKGNGSPESKIDRLVRAFNGSRD